MVSSSVWFWATVVIDTALTWEMVSSGWPEATDVDTKLTFEMFSASP